MVSYIHIFYRAPLYRDILFFVRFYTKFLQDVATIIIRRCTRAPFQWKKNRIFSRKLDRRKKKKINNLDIRSAWRINHSLRQLSSRNCREREHGLLAEHLTVFCYYRASNASSKPTSLLMFARSPAHRPRLPTDDPLRAIYTRVYTGTKSR